MEMRLSDKIQNPAPAADADKVRVYDEFGRELFISRDEWQAKVLPGNLEKNWDDPDKLYSIVLGALNDGFIEDVRNAAAHLNKIDTVPSRGACAYAIVLMKTNHLDEAERVLQSYLRAYGDDGSVLTNLAKVYSARNRHAEADATLWHALEVDPNQANGLGWFYAIHRERSGEAAAMTAVARVASLPGSWRARMWMARDALMQHKLDEALALYREALDRAGEPTPGDLLTQFSGDLGNAGHLRDLILIAEPRYIAQVHGLAVGNNLIKAHLDLGEFEKAQKILEGLHALGRPEFRPKLTFWEQEIAKVRLRARPSVPAPFQIVMGTIQGPVWLKPTEDSAQIAPPRQAGSPSICFLGSTAALKVEADGPHWQLANAPGRMSRAPPLYLAEQMFFRTGGTVQTLVPVMAGEAGAFLLAGAPWSDEDGAQNALKSDSNVSWIVLSHLICVTEPWTAHVRLVRISGPARVAERSILLDPAHPAASVEELTTWLAAELAEHAVDGVSPAPGWYAPPSGEYAGNYMLRLEQLLTVRCASLPSLGASHLNNEREMFVGALQLCATFPQCVPARILVAQLALAFHRVRPAIAAEFRPQVDLLQTKWPLPELFRRFIQKLLDEAFQATS
jgi:tetratricopeptide (TPR) repeat protein